MRSKTVSIDLVRATGRRHRRACRLGDGRRRRLQRHCCPPSRIIDRPVPLDQHHAAVLRPDRMLGAGGLRTTRAGAIGAVARRSARLRARGWSPARHGDGAAPRARLRSGAAATARLAVAALDEPADRRRPSRNGSKARSRQPPPSSSAEAPRLRHRSASTNLVGRGGPADDRALRADHGKRGRLEFGEVALRRVLGEQAFKAAVVGLAHGGLHADLRGDAGEDETA